MNMPIDYQETSKDLKTRIGIHQKYGGRDIDAWMLETLKPEANISILDVGCGSGKQCKAFYSFLDGKVDITGVDVSRELLADAEALNKSLGNPFRIQEMDFNRSFPFPDDSFDLVTCCFAIYYADDIPFTIREMHRVLKPGGRLFTTGPMPENKQLFYEVIKQATGKPIPPMPGSSRYASEILETVKSNFASTDLEIFENPLAFDAVEPFISYTRASLSEDRKLWTSLFQGTDDFEHVMSKIEEVARGKYNEEGKLVMTKVVGGIIAEK
jgi:ubiquinone/menaquinone biosynthesis C-methylase UbiE